MEINNVAVKKGENTTVKIKVGDLPSGNSINLFAHVFRSKKDGPTMLILGGVHGDEINGVEIVRRAVKAGFFNKLTCGNVIAVPLLNIYGFINFSRDLPDGKDVNRSFPGVKNGSLAARVAYALTHHFLPLADFVIDFHTGGNSIYNFPQVRITSDDDVSMQLAKDFSPPFIVKSDLIAKSLRRECAKYKKPVLVFEGGESLRIDNFSIQEGLKGIRRVMQIKGMMDGPFDEGQNNILLNEDLWVRANQSGLFIFYKRSGDYVEKGDLLGHITDPYGLRESKVKSPTTGYIFGHNNKPIINIGDALFHIGYDVEHH
jgi:uncharacterized protein